MTWVGGLLALVAVGVGLVAFVRLPPRHALAAAVLAGAAALAALRMFPIAVPAAAIGLRMWTLAGRHSGAAAPRPGQRSGVRTAGLAMTLDHDSAAMDGEVLAGPFEGRMLSDLSAAELNALLGQFEAGDEDSAALLHVYLERRGAGARSSPGAERDHGPEPRPPPPDPGAMPTTTAEAYAILGLPPGASVEEVRDAYHRLIRRVHPDLGGSSPLAAMINAAKEMLDPG